MNDKLVFFWQDIANYKDCQIRKFGSRAIQATPEECLGLERDAVWDEDVEERLLDATLRRRNNSEEVLKVRLSDCSKIDFDHQMRRFVLNVNSTATPLYGHLVSWGYGGGGQTWLQVLQERIGNELGSEAISTLEYNNTSDGFTIRSLQRAILFRIQLWIRAWERNPSELYAFIGSLPDGVVIPAQTNDTR